MKGKRSVPLASRIKKLMQTDDDVGKIAQSTPVIIGRAMELFLQQLVEHAMEAAQKREAKTVTASHLKSYVMGEETMDFLKDVVAAAPDLKEDAEGEAKPKRRRAPSKSTKAKSAAEAEGADPMDEDHKNEEGGNPVRKTSVKTEQQDAEHVKAEQQLLSPLSPSASSGVKREATAAPGGGCGADVLPFSPPKRARAARATKKSAAAANSDDDDYEPSAGSGDGAGGGGAAVVKRGSRGGGGGGERKPRGAKVAAAAVVAAAAATAAAPWSVLQTAQLSEAAAEAVAALAARQAQAQMQPEVQVAEPAPPQLVVSGAATTSSLEAISPEQIQAFLEQQLSQQQSQLLSLASTPLTSLAASNGLSQPHLGSLGTATADVTGSTGGSLPGASQTLLQPLPSLHSLGGGLNLPALSTTLSGTHPLLSALAANQASQSGAGLLLSGLPSLPSAAGGSLMQPLPSLPGSGDFTSTQHSAIATARTMASVDTTAATAIPLPQLPPMSSTGQPRHSPTAPPPSSAKAAAIASSLRATSNPLMCIRKPRPAAAPPPAAAVQATVAPPVLPSVTAPPAGAVAVCAGGGPELLQMHAAALATASLLNQTEAAPAAAMCVPPLPQPPLPQSASLPATAVAHSTVSQPDTGDLPGVFNTLEPSVLPVVPPTMPVSFVLPVLPLPTIATVATTGVDLDDDYDS